MISKNVQSRFENIMQRSFGVDIISTVIGSEWFGVYGVLRSLDYVDQWYLQFRVFVCGGSTHQYFQEHQNNRWLDGWVQSLDCDQHTRRRKVAETALRNYCSLCFYSNVFSIALMWFKKANHVLYRLHPYRVTCFQMRYRPLIKAQ